MVATTRINFQQGAKRNLKPMEAKDKQEYKGKNVSQNSSKGNSNNNKAKEKGVFKGKNKLTPKELECYRKENKCSKYGEQGHSYRSCPKRNTRNEQPRASMVEAPKEDVHCKGSPLSYAWGKVREHDAFIFFDPGSTHNFISLELAAKLGVQDFEMGDAMKADGAFIGQEVSVTPLIGKLRLYIQGYVDKEDFFISPLKHEDVILGAPWFDHLATSTMFLETKISFKFSEKDIFINAQEPGSTIPLVNDQAFDKSIKSSISVYMIFVKDSLDGVNETQVVHDDVHIDVNLGKLEKGTLPTPTTVESGTDAIVDAMVVDAYTEAIVDAKIVDACTNDIVDAMVVDACTDAIADATIVDACTNDIVDAMEVDASTNFAIDGNVNDGGTESIVRAVIDGILDAVVDMGTDATVESGTDAILDASTDSTTDGNVNDGGAKNAILDASIYSGADGNVNDGGIESIVHNVIDAILDAIVAMGTDATIESSTDAIVDAMVVDACTDAMADATVVDASRNDIVDAMDVDASTNADAEVVCPSDASDDIVDAEEQRIPLLGVPKVSLEVPCGRAAAADTDETGTKNADKESKNGHEDERQERVKCLVVMSVQIVALPPVTCKKSKGKDKILDVEEFKLTSKKGKGRGKQLEPKQHKKPPSKKCTTREDKEDTDMEEDLEEDLEEDFQEALEEIRNTQ
ncbi:hypothetical protein L7F22_007988 [Adiantum nelumboides]|nr:hypothetical protein [Adiantum nelumboides]